MALGEEKIAFVVCACTEGRAEIETNAARRILPAVATVAGLSLFSDMMTWTMKVSCSACGRSAAAATRLPEHAVTCFASCYGLRMRNKATKSAQSAAVCRRLALFKCG